MKFRHILLWIVVLVTLAVPRFDRIERPVTVDELTWLTFSADFYYGAVQGEYDRTYQDHHPGVTTLLAGMGAYLLEFPAYRAYGQGYMENDTFKLIDFLEFHGIDIYDILITARRLMAGASILGLLLAFWFLWRLLGELPAFTVMLFIVLDPFVLGQTRLYSHEGLMSVLVLLSWVSFFYYLRSDKHWLALAISGLAAGAAALTKITALALLPLIGLVWLAETRRGWNQTGKDRSWQSYLKALRPLLIWGVLLVGLFCLLWPAMWADPLGRIAYLIDHTRGFSGATRMLIPLSVRLTGITDYLASIWAHATPVTWLGVVLFLIAAAFRKRFNPDRSTLALAGWPHLYNLVVLLVISLVVTAIRGPRYMASIHLFLALTAGIGFALTLAWIRQWSWTQRRAWLPSVILAVLLTTQAALILPAAPYYYTYNQPLTVGRWWDVHGAFLDQAGEYLAAQPNAEDLTVMTFSPGSLMDFFPGEIRLVFPIPRWEERDVRHLTESDYLVLDSTIRLIRNPPRVIADIDQANISPVFTAGFDGRTLVWVYRVSDLPPEAFIPDP